MTDPIETAELHAFVRIVDGKSLSRAAAELGVPRATISRRLQRLEERLAVRLLRRTTRSLALTDAGERFYRHARMVLDAVAQAEASVRRDDRVIRGELRVSVPPIDDPAFHAMLTRFAESHPEVRMQVHSSSQYVDLIRGGYDVALRASVALEPGLVARTLLEDALVAVAAPSYLEKHGTPRTRGELRKHRLLLGFARGELPMSHWPLIGGGKLHVEGTFVTNDIGLLADAAVRGLGIAMLPSFLVQRTLEEVALVPVLPGVLGARTRLSLVYPERELMPPQARAFVDAVMAWAPTGLPATMVRGRRRGERCPPASGVEGRARKTKR